LPNGQVAQLEWLEDAGSLVSLEEGAGISQTLATNLEQGKSFHSPFELISAQSSLFALFGSPDPQFEYDAEPRPSLHKHMSVLVHPPVFVPPVLNLSE
jgi:hypothetical protein